MVLDNTTEQKQCQVKDCNCTRFIPPSDKILRKQLQHPKMYTPSHQTKNLGLPTSTRILMKMVLLTAYYPALETDLRNFLKHEYYQSGLNDNSNRTVLSIAAENAHGLSNYSTVELLVKNGAIVHLKDYKMKTAIDYITPKLDLNIQVYHQVHAYLLINDADTD